MGIESEGERRGVNGCDPTTAEAESELKVRRRLFQMEPMDYDAPGTTVRETGV